MAKNSRSSDEPASYQFVAIKFGSGWSVVTAFLKNPVDALLLKAMKLPKSTMSTGLQQGDAEDLAEKINCWIGSAKATKKKRK